MSHDLEGPSSHPRKSPPFPALGLGTTVRFREVCGATLLALSPVETGSQSPQVAAAGLGVRLGRAFLPPLGGQEVLAQKSCVWTARR